MSHRNNVWIYALVAVGVGAVVLIAHHPTQPVKAQQATINGIPNQTIMLSSSSVQNLTAFIQSLIPTKLSAFTNDVGLITAAQSPVQSVNGLTGAVSLTIPSKLSQLTNDTMTFTGSIAVPSTLVSLGTIVTPVANGSIPANSFWLCSFNTTNTTAQSNLEVYGNVPAAGTLNVITRNASTSLLGTAYNINYKCTMQ